jgi:DNA-binding transcriptional LysR family regulator
LVANDLAIHLAAVRAGLGVCLLLRRLVPKDVRIADVHFLPRLPVAASCIHLNEGLQASDAKILHDVLSDVMPPNAPLGSEAQGREQERALI